MVVIGCALPGKGETCTPVVPLSTLSVVVVVPAPPNADVSIDVIA